MKDAVSSLVAITPCSLCISFFQVYPSDDKLPLKLPLPEHTVSGLTPAVLVNLRGFKLHMLFSLHPEDIPSTVSHREGDRPRPLRKAKAQRTQA